MRNPSLDQMAERAMALTIECPECRQPANVRCGYRDLTGAWHELENWPAHLRRIKVAKTEHEANRGGEA